MSGLQQSAALDRRGDTLTPNTRVSGFSEAENEQSNQSSAMQPEILRGRVSSRSGWTPELTHRLRVLLCTLPFTDLRRSEGLLAKDRQHYDFVALALRVFDLIIESQGLEHEVDSAAIRRALSPMLVSMDLAAGFAPDELRHDAVVDRLLGELRNDGASRQAFRLEYTDVDDNDVATRRALFVYLVRDAYAADGSLVLRLSNEAINLFLSALELDIEDAQTATEAVLESQLKRGKYDDAARSARSAKLQSVRYAEKLDEIFRETRRDIRRVDWRAEVPRMLEDAQLHIEGRINAERNILQAAERQHDHLDPASAASQRVGAVTQLVRDCMERHLHLQNLVMRAHGVFLDEQGRQAFAPLRVLRLPELRTRILEPMLTMQRNDANALAVRAYGLLCPPSPPPLLALDALIQWQLRPRREVAGGVVERADRELAGYGDDPLRYPAALRERAEGYLNVDVPTTLSDVLARARDAGESPEVLEVISFRALHLFAPEPEDAASLSILPASKSELRTPGFYGDDVTMTPTIPETISPAIAASVPPARSNATVHK